MGSLKGRMFFASEHGQKPPRYVNYEKLDADLRNKLPNEFRNVILRDECNYSGYFGQSHCGLYFDEGSK